ncbi:MAG: hypothetical protein HY913_04515 [Desulfomonile tiedjei]|nr:hypothetical protein [Desulfomonile tiedjei]
MIGKIVRLYLAPIKAYLLLALFVAFVSYVGYLKYQIGSYERQVSALTEQVKKCEDDRAYCEEANQFCQENTKTLIKHYESRKPLDLRDGEIRPNELKISPREK